MRDTAALHLDLDLAAARSRTTPSGFLSVTVEEMSEWLYPAVTPEKSAYCLEPDPVGDRCLIEPHTLVLQPSLANRTSDRIIDASFSLEAPELVLLEAQGPRYVPGDGRFLPFARFRYDPDTTTSDHRIPIGLLQPTEARRAYLLVTFPEPAAAPDRLTLELVAEAVEVPVEAEKLLTRITFKQEQATNLSPLADSPGVQLSSYNAARDGTLEIKEIAAPGLLAVLPPDLRRVAPLFRFRTTGLRGIYQALFPLELLGDRAKREAVCSATLSGGQWTITPVERRGSSELSVQMSVDHNLSRPGATQDQYVTLVIQEASEGLSNGCP